MPLPADEVTQRSGIPVTGVSRTLLDLASVLGPSQLERAINETELRALTDSLSLPDLLARYPRRHGTPALRAVLEGDGGVSKSKLESRFLMWLGRVGLPRPERNAHVQAGGIWLECDCVWRVVRVTWRQLHDSPESLAADLRLLVALK